MIIVVGLVILTAAVVVGRPACWPTAGHAYALTHGFAARSAT
jgi:hypothetical protein